eukprot:TRINITY_DN674_c0_g1_i2.p1 TRINITY_DN674_c0_g1~~TRINITY_DN674_c0_g1_i2.p1  ORF type:complete len:314 (-),score=76.49 TRINITY_DN674_c0_g1_i2:233-1174(-)
MATNSELWFSADDVGAWQPQLPQEQLKKRSKKANPLKDVAILPSQGGFFELHSFSDPTSWDNYVVTPTPPTPSKAKWTNTELHPPPQLPETEFLNAQTSEAWQPVNWSTSGSSSGASSPSKSDSESKTKRNVDIEAELNRQNLYKTELCRSWNESGYCRYGTKCQFAHGQHELRPVMRHPKYKTEICKTFDTKGTCPYGKRCRFVHHPVEQRVSGLEEPSDEATNEQEHEEVEPEQEPELEQEQVQVQQVSDRLVELRLSLLAPDPIFAPPGLSSSTHSASSQPSSSTVVAAGAPPKKGSRLPFFQKLRKQKH